MRGWVVSDRNHGGAAARPVEPETTEAVALLRCVGEKNAHEYVVGVVSISERSRNVVLNPWDIATRDKTGDSRALELSASEQLV